MPIKQFLVCLSVLSWLWLWDGRATAQASTAAAEETSPQVDDTSQHLPPDMETQIDSVTIENNRLQNLGVSPGTRTEPDEKLCESPEVIVASCEPTPGSPLSAFPLVLNIQSR